MAGTSRETLPAPPASSTFSFMLPERGAVAHYDQFKPPMRPAYRGAKRRWTSAGVRHHVPWSTSIPRFSPYSRPETKAEKDAREVERKKAVITMG